MTAPHDELVQRAAKWLTSRSVVVITEMTSGAYETPDAIGFTGHRSTLIECKTSMADFRADGKKPARRLEAFIGDGPNARGWLGTMMGDLRYYLVPEGLSHKVQTILDAEDSPWGLLVAPEDKRRRLVKARDARDHFQGNTHQSEIALLLSAIRRIGTYGPNLDGAVNVRAYVIHKQQGTARATMTIRRPEASDTAALTPKEEP